MQRINLYAKDGRKVASPEIAPVFLEAGVPAIVGYQGRFYQHKGVAFDYHEARFVAIQDDPPMTGWEAARRRAQERALGSLGGGE